MTLRSLLVVVHLLCAVPTHAIVGGHTLHTVSSKDEELYRSVTVRYLIKGRVTDNVFCTGVHSGIRENLSAGHCFSDEIVQKALQDGKVYAEYVDPKKSGQRIRIQVDSVQHRYSDEADIALIRLRNEGPVQQSFPLAFNGCGKDAEYTLAGYGVFLSEEGDDDTSFFLKTAKSIDSDSPDSRHIFRYAIGNILNNPPPPGKSRKTILRAGQEKPSQIDDQTLGKNWLLFKQKDGKLCKADSGGPVFCRSQGQVALAGVISFVTQPNNNDPNNTLSVEEACAARTHVFAARLAGFSEQIQSWRRENQESAGLKPELKAGGQ